MSGQQTANYNNEFEKEESRQSNSKPFDVSSHLLVSPTPQNTSFASLSLFYKSLIILLILISASAVALSIIFGIELNSDSSSSSGGKIDCTEVHDTPKNLIIMIGDGMGTSYNTAYRMYKQQSKSTMDQYYKGKYSTSPTNKWGITDSAAGAVALASGFSTHNDWVGVDQFANPHGSILAAAKRKGKGTGVVATKSITDATPAAFTAHAMYRYFSQMIAEQQVKRQIDGKPMIDVLFGGGRRYFDEFRDGTDFWHNASIYHDEYGWNTLIDEYSELLELNANGAEAVDILPVLGLFAVNHFPYYLDRIHNSSDSHDINGTEPDMRRQRDGVMEDEEEMRYPSLFEMSAKAIELLDAKFNADVDESDSSPGFFLMIEGSEIDWCGHDNDIVCLLWEMDEFVQTVEYVMEYARKDNNTLVVILADHETGGLQLGSNALYTAERIRRYDDGRAPIDWETEGFGSAVGDYIHDPILAPPSAVSSILDSRGLYKWYPVDVLHSKHTADWIATEMTQFDNVEDVYALIEEHYIGSSADASLSLSDIEKEFIAGAWQRSSSTRLAMVCALMNKRTLTGWTTTGHSGADVSLYGFGPSANRLQGHFLNSEVGQLLSEIFEVADEQAIETEYIQNEFKNGDLLICDEGNPQRSIYEWATNISYPEGNFLFPGYCVEQWMD